jgi:hypothetical protein
LGGECSRKNTHDSQEKFAARLKLSHDRYSATLKDGQFVSLGLIIIARPLPLLALAIVHVRGYQQFKAHVVYTL